MRKTYLSPLMSSDPLEYVLSDETVDRAGDVIEAQGWKLDNFLKNPVALFGHDHKFIIGAWANVRVQGKRLLGRLKLLPVGISERLDEIRAAVDAGVLRAVSVGFGPDKADAEPRNGGGWRYRSAELFEASLVAVPMNPSALQLAKALDLSDEAKGLIFGGGARSLVVKLDGIARARLKGTLRIHTAPRWKPGDPIKVPKTRPAVARLSPEERAAHGLDKSNVVQVVVKLSDEDRARARRRMTTRVVKIGGR
jgi:HK97 family phage prohead protease